MINRNDISKKMQKKSRNVLSTVVIGKTFSPLRFSLADFSAISTFAGLSYHLKKRVVA